MQVHRKGTDDAIRLRLKLNDKTTEELQQILLRRDPGNTNRYSYDAKTRRAAIAVLRVRGMYGVPSTPMPEPVMPDADTEANRVWEDDLYVWGDVRRATSEGICESVVEHLDNYLSDSDLGIIIAPDGRKYTTILSAHLIPVED